MDFKPKPGWLLLAMDTPPPPPSGLVVVTGERNAGIPAHTTGTVVEMTTPHPDLKTGDRVAVLPHSGHLLPTPEGEAQILTLPYSAVIGIVEED